MSAVTSQNELEVLASRSHLDRLEAEAITIIREVVSGCESPVLLFSGGKDSAVLLWLAIKAFTPARLPFPVMQVDTGHNFPEVIEYRDEFVRTYNLELIVASVQASIDRGDIPDPAPLVAVTVSKQSLFFRQFVSTSLMLHSVVDVAMKTKHAQKNESSVSVTRRVDGNHVCSAQSHGTF